MVRVVTSGEFGQGRKKKRQLSDLEFFKDRLQFYYVERLVVLSRDAGCEGLPKGLDAIVACTADNVWPNELFTSFFAYFIMKFKDELRTIRSIHVWHIEIDYN